MAQARYIMIGGFLGAGKTTAVLRLAEHLVSTGARVGLITNDQSVGLVDTAMLSSHGFDVQEITGGCFCCRFNSLVDASERLSKEQRPDVFIAEPVGSCTDLKASVSYPLRRMYGEDFSVAPLSVLIDPIRALRVLGLEAGKVFSPKVVYIYAKQLEEAEMIVVNKSDLLTPKRSELLKKELSFRFPNAEIFEVSARQGTGLADWFERLGHSDLDRKTSMPLDYDVYAEGEALLGWLNATVDVSASAPVDGNALLISLAEALRARLSGFEIAHLKMTLTPGDAVGDIAVVNLVRSDHVIETSHSLTGPIQEGKLIINLRAEADPDFLRAAALAALETVQASRAGVTFTVEHIEHFRPGRPQPTYRLAEA